MLSSNVFLMENQQMAEWNVDAPRGVFTWNYVNKVIENHII